MFLRGCCATGKGPGAREGFRRPVRRWSPYAFWIASGEVQRGLYAQSGGQPGHAAAWEDDGVNAATGDFYRATRRTLEAAFVRPRHDGYMAFQNAASKRLNAGLLSGERPAAIVADLDRLYRESF